MSQYGNKEFLDRLLTAMVQEKASDIYLKAEAHPTLRVEGNLSAIDTPKLAAQDTWDLAQAIMPEEEKKTFPQLPEANFVYNVDKIGRFRVNAYIQRGTVGLVLRKVRDDILEFEQLGLPPVLKEMALYKRGLVLITGPTGSGKSTTLATMVRYRNINTTGHILTIEDPIEFVHQDINCIVSQREVGTDTRCFREALENALRQAPDVLLVGEMRDMESVKTGVYFAETGHLVLSTLHSSNAPQTIERILQFFPSAEHEQVLQLLSFNLRAVVCQRLLPVQEGPGRVVALEIMVVNARMRELITKGYLDQIRKELDVFLPDGMRSFDTSYIEHYKAGTISLEECVKSSDNPRDMKLKLKKMGAISSGLLSDE